MASVSRLRIRCSASSSPSPFTLLKQQRQQQRSHHLSRFPRPSPSTSWHPSSPTHPLLLLRATFSTSPPQRATRLPQPKLSQPSHRVTMRQKQAEMMDSGDLLDHAGLLENTFIPPRSSSPDLPSLLSRPRQRLGLHLHHLRVRIWETIQNVMVSQILVKPRVNLLRARREAKAFAKESYVKMNEALAAGELYGMEEQLSSGLRESLQRRIDDRRPELNGLRWRLVGWTAEPKVESCRFVVMPTTSGKKKTRKDGQHGILQAVVRLRTRQSLLRTRRRRNREGVLEERVLGVEGEEVRGGEEVVEREFEKRTREVEELFVVQRLLKKGVMGRWMVWGMAEESKVPAEKEERGRGLQEVGSKG